MYLRPNHRHPHSEWQTGRDDLGYGGGSNSGWVDPAGISLVAGIIDALNGRDGGRSTSRWDKDDDWILQHENKMMEAKPKWRLFGCCRKEKYICDSCLEDKEQRVTEKKCSKCKMTNKSRFGTTPMFPEMWGLPRNDDGGAEGHYDRTSRIRGRKDTASRELGEAFADHTWSGGRRGNVPLDHSLQDVLYNSMELCDHPILQQIQREVDGLLHEILVLRGDMASDRKLKSRKAEYSTRIAILKSDASALWARLRQTYVSGMEEDSKTSAILNRQLHMAIDRLQLLHRIYKL